ncbi:MAG: AAA family ATPase [Gammaproteobacteria bacterium]|nr:AAA family ATPase [Gammaproteobacteria bacterium]
MIQDPNLNDFFARFNLNMIPFTREIKVKERFQSEVYEVPLTHLTRTVSKSMSGVLIAPAGTGKTALLRALVDRLPEARFKVHYVKVTDLSKRDFCREISVAIHAKSSGTYASLVRNLQDRFLEARQADHVQPVLVLDEAHDIRPDVLGILRLLTNFEMDSRLVVSIILVGQPALAGILSQDRLRDVAERLAHRATLRLLELDELREYVKHRCRIAGASSCPFTSEAVNTLFEYTRGNLRATDRLGLKSLEVAHDHESDAVDATHVREARELIL